MLKKINKNFAAKFLLLFSLLGIIFHIFVILRVVPYTIVWGGRADDKNYLILELVSLLVLATASFIIAGRAKYINVPKLDKFFYFGCWCLFAVFILNTLGNIVSPVPIERYFFSIITFVIALLMLRLISKK